MANFCIRVTNQSFESQNEHDVPTLEEASAAAIKGALQIGADEIDLANPFFAAEIRIERDGEHLARYVVSLGVSPLR